MSKLTGARNLTAPYELARGSASFVAKLSLAEKLGFP